MVDHVTSSTREHQGYITLDSFASDKGDPGGFGFGGSNGVTGGFGVGGAGPQPGREPHRQAHYRRRAKPGVTLPQVRVSTKGAAGAGQDEHHDYPVWLEGFPHSFHGWGPNAPEYDGSGEQTDVLAQSATHLGFLEMTVMTGADPFATDLIWRQRK